jgi:uncharacterized surface anchored protein
MQRRIAVLLAMLMVLSLANLGLTSPASAATKTVYIETVDIATGESITTACYVLIDASEEGCDENGDGLIRYQGVAAGEFTVTQSVRAPGYLPMGDFPVTIFDDGFDQYIFVALARADGVTRNSVDVAIAPVDGDTGAAIYGACFIFHGGSEEGCDENFDGRITYQGMATGSYLLSQTVDIDGYLTRADSWVAVTRGGALTVALIPEAGSSPPPSSGLVDVSIVTRANNGELLAGACYIIIDASIEGCDENGDGQVDYQDVAPGNYMVTQTRAPSGQRAVGDFPVTITSATEQVFTVNQSGWSAGNTNISLIAVDAATGERIDDPNICLVLVGGSEEGCDDNIDGQVDFFGVAPGRYLVDIIGVPRGYIAYDVPLSITVTAIANQQFFEIPFIPR